MCATEHVLTDKRDITAPEIEIRHEGSLVREQILSGLAAALLMPEQPAERVGATHMEPMEFTSHSAAGFIHVFERSCFDIRQGVLDCLLHRFQFQSLIPPP